MNNQGLLKVFVDIDNASEITAAIIRTVYYDDNFGSERLRWLLAGALEQVEKIRQMAESIDGVLWKKENFLI